MGRAILSLTAIAPILVSAISFAEEIVIEDRIGDPISTNGRGSLMSFIRGATYAATVGKYHISQNVRLTRIEGIGVPYFESPVPINSYGWKIAIHSNEISARGTALMGDLLPLTSLPTPVIESAGTNNYGYPSYLVSFDFSSTPGLDNILLNANTDCWITVLGTDSADWDWMESSISAGDSDFLVGDDEFIWTWNSSDAGFPIGRAALKFIGETLPDPGDYDRDGDVDGRDFLVWQREYGATVPRYDGADGNGDGMVDGEDLAVWQEHYGTSNVAASNTVPEPSGVVASFLLIAWLSVNRFGSGRFKF